MRSALGLAFASLAIFSSSLAVTHRQEEKKAEQQFKNIKSFTGKKASDVIPAMEFMSASLKESCDYCHTADRASDDKPEKKTAREMIAMQNDINAKNFDGRLVVTCATCHAGHTHPINLPPVEGVESRVRRSRDVSAAVILEAYAKAVGTPAHPIQAISLQGTTVAEGAKQTVEEIHAGDKFLVSTKGGKTDSKIGFNGADAWFMGPKGAITIPPQYAGSFIKKQTILLGPDTLPKLDNPSAGTAKIGDRDMLVVTGMLAGTKDRASIFFDKTTSLPARLTYSYATILGSIPQVNDFSDYKNVDGTPFPMTIGRHSGEADAVTHFTSAHPNPKIDPKIFDPSK